MDNFTFFEITPLYRLLEDVNGTNATTNGTSDGNVTSTAQEDDSVILRATFTTYGSVFLVVFFLFCWARQRYPKAFNLRNWVEERKTPLADSQYGFFSWTWNLASIPDETFLDECGMDAVCHVRIIYMGLKLCMVGMICAIFLMPLYFTAHYHEETAEVTDNIARLTTGHLGPGSPRFAATAVACWIVFGFTMKTIHDELENWFFPLRHRYLMRRAPGNHAVYVRNIPPHYRTDQALRLFFKKSIEGEALEVHIAKKTSNLQDDVAEREDTISRLEHAVAEEEVNGSRPTHKVDTLLVPIPGIRPGEEVDSINYYAEELKAANKDIAKKIDDLRREEEMDIRAVTSGEEESTELSSEDDTGFFSFVKSNTLGVVSNVADSATNVVATGASGLAATAGEAMRLLGGEEDGEVLSAGFVVFKKLSNVQAALRMTHYKKPYEMECVEAPEPYDVYWKNVGRQHRDLELGKLFSLGATTAACLLWTIPVTFVNSISSVDSLRKEIGFIDDMLDTVPFMVPVFEVLAPQFLVILNALLPIFLEIFSTLEGHVSSASLEASLFVKLAAFMIIQTFFVSALSGGIMKELSGLVEDPWALVDLLATSLPAQSTFFMQLSITMTVTSFAVEGLRIAPLATALVRRFVGPRLTEKERSKPYMGLRPLNDPEDFAHGDFLSNIVFFFIVFLVYAAIAPLVSFVLALCFLVLGSMFRHHFVYVYNKIPDSGGILYLNFMQILASCLLIGEITIAGLLALKKSAAGTPLMLPLIITTVLFNSYIRKKHLEVAIHLPSRLASKQDKKNEGADFSFVSEAYLQPELKERKAFPELPLDQLHDLGLASTDEEEGFVDPERPVSCRVTKLELSQRESADSTFFDNNLSE